jgi:hypothetical protein
MSRLLTFVPPRPKRWMIRALTPVSRIVFLRGLMKVNTIDFPAADEARFRAHVNADTAAFIAPNHPEFLTDWLLDKELSARYAPLMASWATHDVGNGMGAAMQWFWLSNNLIAQIPGAGGAAGKAYSVGWALQGHAVLLHPEGSVAWTADRVQPLFGGVADMALEAARRASPPRRTWVVPVIWRYRFARDVHDALGRELDLVDRKLHHPGSRDADPARRVLDLYSAMLERDECQWSLSAAADQPFATRQKSMLLALTIRLGAALDRTGFEPLQPASDDAVERSRAVVRRADRWLRDAAPKTSSARDEIRALAKTLRRANRFDPAWYPSSELTQEQVAENVKRLRADYCFTGLSDNVHRFVPRPVGPRIAHIRVPEPIDVAGGSFDEPEGLLAELRNRMQRTLDAMAAQLPAGRRYPNPFREPQISAAG